jgi:hypothetical protein
LRFRRSIAHFYARVGVGVHLRWVQSMYQSSKAEENLMWDRQPKVGRPMAFSHLNRKAKAYSDQQHGDRRPPPPPKACTAVSPCSDRVVSAEPRKHAKYGGVGENGRWKHYVRKHAGPNEMDLFAG